MPYASRLILSLTPIGSSAASAQAQTAVPQHKHDDKPAVSDATPVPGETAGAVPADTGRTYLLGQYLGLGRTAVRQSGPNLADAFNHADAACWRTIVYPSVAHAGHWESREPLARDVVSFKQPRLQIGVTPRTSDS